MVPIVLHLISPTDGCEVSFDIEVPGEIEHQLMNAGHYMKVCNFSTLEISDKFLDISLPYIPQKLLNILDPDHCFRDAHRVIKLLREVTFSKLFTGSKLMEKAKQMRARADEHMACPYKHPHAFFHTHEDDLTKIMRYAKFRTESPKGKKDD